MRLYSLNMAVCLLRRRSTFLSVLSASFTVTHPALHIFKMGSALMYLPKGITVFKYKNS